MLGNNFRCDGAPSGWADFSLCSELNSCAVNRREFLITAASVTTSRVGYLRNPPTPEPKDAQKTANASPWFAAMRRCGQINFNERDPLTMDTKAWGEYWSSLKVNAVLLNGGGILAFYPTQVPYHRRSEFLGSRDLFREMVSRFVPPPWATRVIVEGDAAYGSQDNIKMVMQRDTDDPARR